MESIINNLAQQLGDVLLSKTLTVTTAESCTGGGIAEAITRVAGSSDWFEQGFVTYSNRAKSQMLNVDVDVLTRYGAVSEQIVTQMAGGALTVSGADLAVAVSGIAGPGGGSDSKPVGTVWFCWYHKHKGADTKCFHFSGGRQAVRAQAVAEGLKGLISLV